MQRGQSSPLFCYSLVQRMVNKEKIEDLAQHVIRNMNDASLFLVDILVSNAKTGQKVVVYVDGDHGVAIDTYGKISRALSEMLDQEDLSDHQYILEVSSPGLDQPLQSARQYKKNVGRNIKVLLQDNQVIKGKLLEVTGEQITISEEAGKAKKKTEINNRQIAFGDIKKTNVLASFK